MTAHRGLLDAKLVARLVAMLLALVVAAGCTSTKVDDAGTTEAIFLETCAPSASPLEEDVCRCAFEKVTEGLDDHELARLDRNLRDDPETVPPEITAASIECAAEVLSPLPTEPPPTVPTSGGSGGGDDEGDRTTTTANRSDQDDEVTTTTAPRRGTTTTTTRRGTTTTTAPKGE